MNEPLKTGEGTKIWHPELSVFGPNFSCGKNCTIHAPVWIDAPMGDNCKVQAFAFIPKGVEMGDDVFVGPRATFTNDKYPPSHGRGWQKTIVKNGASFGASSTMLPGITVGEFSKIGAGSIVTKDVPDRTLVMGNPAHVYVKKDINNEKNGKDTIL